MLRVDDLDEYKIWLQKQLIMIALVEAEPDLFRKRALIDMLGLGHFFTPMPKPKEEES